MAGRNETQPTCKACAEATIQPFIERWTVGRVEQRERPEKKSPGRSLLKKLRIKTGTTEGGRRTDRNDDMKQLSVRLTDRMFRQLDEFAAERGITRTRLVRQLLEAGLRERPTPPSERPSEMELLAILTEKARAGNVAAVRTLLAREEAKDPRERAFLAVEQLAAERRQ
jgi:hypothetical protein